jgi:Zn-dependent M28 family amino/carboxypeptidase
MPRHRRIVHTAATGVLLALAACTTPDAAPGSTAGPSFPASTAPAMAGVTPSTTTATPTSTASAAPTRPRPARADAFDADRVLAGIRDLAAIGPRDAASAAYDEAARLVAERFRAAGYRVTIQPFRVPAGVSWGVRVPGGDVVNVVADPPGFDASSPHLVVGAHLDTVPRAPGAEDNASGVMVMLETARRLRQQPAGLPVRFVAFGAEEARSSDGHSYAFGSRHFVAALTDAERRAVRGMVALDRVGVRSSAVPVCSGGRGTPALAREIREAASGVIRTRSCTNRASDHVSFEAAGVPAARIGSVPYAAYHSRRDVPSVVDRGQLARVGAVFWAWLGSLDG